MVRDKGFTLIELLAVASIIAILALVSAPNVIRFYKAYKFYDYAYSMESLVRWSKLTAMELTTNVGVCIENSKRISVRDMGETRSLNACTGNTLRVVSIDPGDTEFNFYGSGVSFDPRGFAINTGNVCFTDGNKYYKLCVSRFGAIRMESGRGGCTPCS